MVCLDSCRESQGKWKRLWKHIIGLELDKHKSKHTGTRTVYTKGIIDWEICGEMWMTSTVALLDGDGDHWVEVEVEVGSRGWVSGLESIKKKSARQLSGCRKAHLVGFHGPRLLSPAFPGATRKTQASAGLQVAHTHARTYTLIYTETHTFFLSFMPDYNRIILTRFMHFQTYTIIWERWTVQKITIISAYI